jgi:hypothetical protein
VKRRLGCLSRSGLAAGGAALAVILAVMLIWGGRLFSPGQLNAQQGETLLGGVRSHAETGGGCSACHAPFWSSETMSDRCLACHTEITAQLQDPQSLHGAFVAGGDPLACRDCHAEHRGATAQLTVVDAARFPHDATGYSLQGHRRLANGQTFACADCHGPDLARFDVATCATCHRKMDAAYMEAHVAAFGLGCLACHDGLDAYGPQFDHDQTAFPLQGQHAALDCIGCHRGAPSIADLQATPQDCFACHQQDDAHDGQFGQDCGQCHTPAGWAEATFDHSQTAFPLTGKHQGVACAQCHADNVFQGTPTDCFACHQKDDAHDGQFGQGCGQCHTAAGWQDVTFDHSQTAFPLTGAHGSVACLQCHTGGVFQGTPTACVGCHQDPAYHAGLFGTGCADCHNTGAWTPARFDRAHTFPLDHGERAQSSCQTCHPDRLATYTCYGCHEHDPTRIQAEHREEGITDLQDCVRCHPTGREEERGGGDD